ncbi:MAG: DegT/DnrJ/EryC1/StrS family aminotransferase [Bacteroidaceae bacterium]|nr:DegT/DnrJ/EryC1/StrS family aminotransferase [Bacteroidaceae bacterium]
MEFRNLKKQYEILGPQLDAAMNSVAAGSRYIMGPEVGQLEEALAQYVGAKHCISCANGTDALQLALMTWGVGPGDAVFVPDFTFFSSAEVVAAVGATPVFVDVRPETFNIDPEDLERAVRETLAGGRLTPKVVIGVDLFGLPASWPEITDIARKYDLKTLEDGAQGFGGSIGGRRACSFGDISTTSFFPAKPLGCYGDGGAVFTDNDEWAELLRSYRVHGKGSCKYDNVRIGMNSRLDTIQAAILQVKLKAFRDYELDDVNAAASLYGDLLDGIPGVVTPVVPEACRSSWAQYTIRLADRATRDGLQAALKAHGIPSMVYYPTPMSAQTVFAGMPRRECPAAAKLCDTVLSLPISPYITPEEQRDVADAIKEYVG